MELSKGKVEIQEFFDSLVTHIRTYVYIMAANISREEQDAEFIISGEVKDANVLFEDRAAPVERFQLNDKFLPVDVHVYKIIVNIN